jgi:hypothetical protein
VSPSTVATFVLGLVQDLRLCLCKDPTLCLESLVSTSTQANISTPPTCEESKVLDLSSLGYLKTSQIICMLSAQVFATPHSTPGQFFDPILLLDDKTGCSNFHRSIGIHAIEFHRPLAPHYLPDGQVSGRTSSVITGVWSCSNDTTPLACPIWSR